MTMTSVACCRTSCSLQLQATERSAFHRDFSREVDVQKPAHHHTQRKRAKWLLINAKKKKKIEMRSPPATDKIRDDVTTLMPCLQYSLLVEMHMYCIRSYSPLPLFPLVCHTSPKVHKVNSTLAWQSVSQMNQMTSLGPPGDPTIVAVLLLSSRL